MMMETEGLMMAPSSRCSSLSRQARVILTVMGLVTVASGVAIGLSRIGFRTNTTVTTTTSTTSTTTSRRPYRIFAFGDSLTAGLVRSYGQEGGSTRFYPYADALRDTLESLLDDPDDEVIVEHMGKSGWKTAELYEILPEDLPYDVMIILAGTNDLGTELSAESIVSNLKDLHEAALRRGVWRTMALAIPSSAYQERIESAREKAKSINNSLKEWNNPRISFVPFPFPFDYKDKRWSQDGLHLTKEGYKVLGIYLAPLVQRELQQLVREQSATL